MKISQKTRIVVDLELLEVDFFFLLLLLLFFFFLYIFFFQKVTAPTLKKEEGGRSTLGKSIAFGTLGKEAKEAKESNQPEEVTKLLRDLDSQVRGALRALGGSKKFSGGVEESVEREQTVSRVDRD